MEEIWKDIEGYEGFYQVSNLGRVKSVERYVIQKAQGFTKKNRVRERVLKKINTGGYDQVQLHIEGKVKTISVARLVAQAFIPNPEKKPCVDHINTIKTDNRAENLRWVTQSENMKNPITNESIKKPKTKQQGRRHIMQYSSSGVFIKEWSKTKDLAEELQLSEQQIRRVCNGEPHRKTAGGFILKWKEKT